jgi:hypothetical protein
MNVARSAAAHAMPTRAGTPTTVWRTNPVVALWSTMVGKKVVMAVTGAVLLRLEVKRVSRRWRPGLRQ